MDSYNFTYKDVIKRHERMINRVEKWEIHALAIIMLVVTAFFTFSTFCFAYEEETLSYDTSANISINPNSNYFASSQGGNVGFVHIEKGYIYKFYNNTTSRELYVAVSDDIPQLNGTYTFLASVSAGESYSYIGDGTYLYFDFTHWSNIEVTREKIEGYSGAIDDLVDNVGVSQLWDTFGSGIDFIYIVVIVGFGIFLVALAIRKISKGKSEI